MKTINKMEKAEYRKEIIKQERNRIVGLLNLCKICGGGHGQWIRKDELIKMINESSQKKTKVKK